jgi:hypothetical protein
MWTRDCVFYGNKLDLEAVKRKTLGSFSTW